MNIPGTSLQLSIVTDENELCLKMIKIYFIIIIIKMILIIYQINNHYHINIHYYIQQQLKMIKIDINYIGRSNDQNHQNHHQLMQNHL